MSTYLLREPRILWLTILLIFAAGVNSFISAPRMEDPLLTRRAAIVNTRLSGADPQRVESLVTDPLVAALREFDEIKELRSSSRAGISTIGIILDDAITEVDEIWARIRDELASTRPDLANSATPPDLDIIDARSYSYILGLTWRGTAEPDYALLRQSASDLEDVLRGVQNTEAVDRFGDPEEEILVEVDQNELSRLGISLHQLARQLALSDAKVATGKIHSRDSDLLLEVAGEFSSLERIGQTVLTSTFAGQTAYLADVATIQKTIAQPQRSAAVVDGQTAIIMAANADASTRLDLWTAQVEIQLESFSKALPESIQLERIFQQSQYVTDRMQQLLIDLSFSALCVVAVVFIMMGWRSGLIVGSALPLAACLVFASLDFLGIPFHQMSLSGLVIALGMLEGCAIIIVDETQHRLREGASRVDAVKSAVGHMALPLFGATVTTVISFLPIATMPGPSGEFVGTIGVSVILALTASFGLALTIIPALSALTSPRSLGDSNASTRAGNFLTHGISSRILSKLYERFLRFAFGRPIATTIAGLLICLPGFLLLPRFDVQFFPGADRNQFHIEIELSPQASLEKTKEVAETVRQRLLSEPRVQRVDWVLGSSAPSFYYNMIGRVKDSSRYGQALVTLSPESDTTQFVNRIQPILDDVAPAAQVRVRQLEQGPPYNAPIEIRVFGEDSNSLRDVGQQIRRHLAKHPDITHIQTDLTDRLPKLVLNVREQEARMLGISLADVSRQLNAALEGIVGGTLLQGDEELPVRVKLANDKRNNLEAIGAIELLPDSNSGGPRSAIRVSSIASTQMTSQPALLSRLDDRKMNEVRGYLKAGVLPATVLAWFKNDLASGAIEVPEGITIQYGGEASKRSEAVGQLLSRVSLLVAAGVFILVLSLRSYLAALVVGLVALCSCGTAFSLLYVAGFPLGFTAIVGAMGMVGIAINDSMVVLSELRSDQQAFQGKIDAVVSVVMRSSRHVLSTTLTVGCSFIPLILGGGTFWPPMAMVVVGGVFGATITALIWIPAVHRIIALRWHSTRDD